MAICCAPCFSMEVYMEETGYETFAFYYDSLTQNVNYDERAEYFDRLIQTFLHSSGNVLLDLACGTGTMSEKMTKRGYDVIGVDYSDSMLNQALEKKLEKGLSIQYVMQDMRELELFGNIRAVVSVCDSMNYIMEPEDLKKVFGLVKEYLAENGVFIFDLNTVHKYRDLMGECTISENREESSFIWENYFYEDEMVNEYDLTLFIREKNDLYRKYEELHYQKAYELEQVKTLLQQAGMEFMAAYDAFTHDPVTAESERMYIIARPKVI